MQQVLLPPQVRHVPLEVKPRSLQPQQGSELLQVSPATGHVRGGGVGAGGGGGGVALGSSQQLSLSFKGEKKGLTLDQ